MSDLSELDDATIDIETAVRRELPEPQKNLKSTVEKSRPKTKRMKRKETAKVTTKKSDTESTEESEESKDETDEESDDESSTSKRKRPSDYIAKKDRPETLKSDKKINKLSLDEAIELCKLSAKRAKLDTTSLDADDAPEKKTFKKFTDDGISRLHPARFERHPIGPPAKWWSQVPVKRTNIIKKIPLRHLGANHMIPSKTIINAHDRSKTLMSKHFTSCNIDVSQKSATERRKLLGSGEIETSVELKFEKAKSDNLGKLY